MKNTLKIAFLLVGILTITFSCQKDDIQLEQESEFISKGDFPFELKTKTYKQLTQNAKFAEALNLITKKSKGQSYNRSRTVMEDQYGFTIDSTRINEVSSEDYTSYTFLIHRDTLTESYFENLVVEIDSTNDITAVIVKYTLNSDMIFNANHNSYAIDAEIEVTNINYDNSYAKLSSDCVGILMCPWDEVDHPATQKCIDEGRGDLYLDTSMCGDGNGGSGSNPDTSNAGNPGNTGDGTDDTCSTCGAGGQNTTDPSNTGDNTDPVVTSTVTDSPEYLRKKDFIRTKLSSEQKDWFNSQPQETQDLIINYLENAYQNGDTASSEYPEEAQEFVLEALAVFVYASTFSSNNQLDYAQAILRLTTHMKSFGNIEDEIYADYIESLIPDLQSMSIGEVDDLYEEVYRTDRNITLKYALAILTPIVTDLVIPIVTYALIEATLGTATVILQRIPVSMVLRGVRLNKMVTKIAKLGIQGEQVHVRIITTSSPVSKAQELFATLTKNAVSIAPANAEGTIVANMGNGNFITYRTVSSSNFPATINLNFPNIFGQTPKAIKFTQ